MRDVVGVQLQEAALNEKITVEEAMRLFASFYASPGDVEELLDLLDLAPHRRVAFAKLSGGQKQRLSIALALVGNPRVAILDELTTGLDPAARRATWELVERVRDRGVTILLVTHFMDEAERLCDRLVIIDRGRVVAQGTPAELVDSVDTSRTVRLRVPPADHDLALHTIAGLADVQHVEAAPGAGREIEVTGSRRCCPPSCSPSPSARSCPTTSGPSPARFEDVFVAVTGRTYDPDATDARPTRGESR